MSYITTKAIQTETRYVTSLYDWDYCIFLAY